MTTKKVLARAAAIGVLALVAPISFAQTSTPTVPDTGAGGDAFSTIALLALSAAIALAGALYLYRQGVLAK